jgi:ribosome assembly protein 1
MLEKITKSLSITLPAHVLRSRDPRNILTTVFSLWLPLSTALLVSVIEYLPSPPTAQAARLPEMIENSPGAESVSKNVRDAMVDFKSGESEPVVAYVSKMVAIPESELHSNTARTGSGMSAEEAREMARRKRAEFAKAQAESNGDSSHISNALSNAHIEDYSPQEEDAEDPEHLIGFARLYSGTLSVGDSVYVLNPKFSPEHPHASPEPQNITVTALYLLMGRSLQQLTSVPAGVVFGIAGLGGYILKTGTLCSQLEGSVNLAGVSLASPPIVRVALEPVNPADLNKMIAGLRLLEQSDPCAQYDVLPSGEHVIVTAGELHLERCLKDLRERFAKCEIQAGEVIVPYRESIVSVPDMAAPKNPELPRGTMLAVSSSKQLTVRIRVRPLPSVVTEFLAKHPGTLKRLYSEKRAKGGGKQETEADDTNDEVDDEKTHDKLTLSPKDFKKQLKDIFKETKEDVWQGIVEKITDFGPRKAGPNILVDATTVNSCEKM